MLIGAVFPGDEIEADAEAIRAWAQAVERMGFNHIMVIDHVVGTSADSRAGVRRPYDIDSSFYEPFTVLSFMASATRTIGFFVGVLVLSQRQTVLVAKQAACVDILCGGRLRLGIGTGWNAAEYEALNVPWVKRGDIFEDQIGVLRALWTQRAVTLKTPYHRITAAGINPLPLQQPIPLWFGGGAANPATGKSNPERVLRRAARLGDGFTPAVMQPDDQAAAIMDRFKRYCREYGRAPETVGVEGMLAVNRGSLDGCTELVSAWQRLGATHIAIDTMRDGLRGCEPHLRRLEEIARSQRLDVK